MIAKSTATQTGTLTRKICSREKHPASRPPSNGPTSAAPDMVAPQTPDPEGRSAALAAEGGVDCGQGGGKHHWVGS